MAQPIPEHTNRLLHQFLAARNIASETPFDIVSHRAGRIVLHLHHDGLDYTIKCFDTQKEDLAQEFEREQQFYYFLKPLQTGRTPLLLDSDPGNQMLLLSRITGRGLREPEVTRQAIVQATDFLAAINHAPDSALAIINRPACGACQAISEHLSAISNLVTSIQQHQSLVNPQTHTFIEAELGPLWQKVLGNILAQFQTASIDIESPLENNALILSPGEFGLHNAVLTPEKEICFVDFDQSGWDDPARVICRFFTLGPIPPKDEHWDLVIEKIGTLENIDPFFGIKARLLLPAYQVARACTPILTCLQEESRPLSDDEEGASHSTTKLINVTNRSRQWLIRANQGV